MDKYEILKQIGDGSYGTVAKAVHKKTNQLVAVKRMKQKYYTWDECIRLAEVQVLRKMNTHPNVVKLKEVLRENNELFFVFEFMDGDMLGVIRQAKQHPPSNPSSPFIAHAKVRAYMYQILQSLVHLHKSGYFHRDMKPENLLIKKDPTNSAMHEIVKLADFGLVKETRARPPYTDYVSTRWYRGPELLLQDRAYGPPVDIWAAGCIMCELISTRPLFPGSNELDQLFRIICVMGAPNEKTWPEGCAMARKLRYTFPNPAQTPLRKMIPAHCPPIAFDLIEKLLVYDPKRRLTASQALQHPYFTATGGGLGDPTFDQPLSTVGIPRPTQTNSAPASQQQYGNGGTSSSAVPSLNWTFNKPATADRPVIDPISISKPPGVGGGSLNYQTYPSGGTDSNNSTMQGGAVPAYKRYSQDMNKLPGVGGSTTTTTANVPAYRAYASSNASTNNTQKPPSHARPPTKIVPSHAYASSGAGGGSGGLPPTSTNPAMARKSPAPVSDDLDDLLDEFTSDVAGTKKSKPYVSSPSASSTAATNSGLNLNLGAIGGASPPGGGGNNNNSSANSGVSPLAKLLNSARYRNGGNTTTTTSGGGGGTAQQQSSVLKPPSSFVSSSSPNPAPKSTATQQQKPRPKPKVNNSFDIDEELAWLDGK